MTRGLYRPHASRQSHLLTFRCYRRLAKFAVPDAFDLFIIIICLENMRQRFGCMRTSLLWFLVATLTVGLPSVALAQVRTAASFTLAIAAHQKAAKAGSDVRIEIVVTNVSRRDITVSRSNGEGQAELSGYTAEVRDRKAHLISETTYGRGLRGEESSSAGPIVSITSDLVYPLQPNQQLKDVLIVNKLRDMSQPGVYVVQVQRTDPDSGILVKSNKITVRVVP